MRKRTKTFSSRLSNEEYENLNRAITKCNMTKSAFMRMIAKHYLPKERPPDGYDEIMSELVEIGSCTTGTAVISIPQVILTACSEPTSVWPKKEKAVSDLYGQQEDIAKKYTALTFDDGPNPKYTKPLLDGLRERGIRVTLFPRGRMHRRK